jgi:putative membrane protein
MLLLAIAESSESHAYGWCEAAAQSGWPGGWAILAALLMGVVYFSSILAFGRTKNGPRWGYFTLALVVWVMTLSGPLERLALSRLYSAYILQQIILVMVVCPALLLGLEGWMLRPLVANRWTHGIFRAISRPGLALAVFVCVFTFIHIPWVCNQLCHVKPFYHTVRLSLFFAGLILWWPLLSPLPEFPRLSQPMHGVYLLALMLAMTVVGASVALADTVLYHFYMGGPHPLGISAIEDQVLGGLLMWVGQGTILTVLAAVIFVRWLSYPEAGGQVRAIEP